MSVAEREWTIQRAVGGVVRSTPMLEAIDGPMLGPLEKVRVREASTESEEALRGFVNWVVFRIETGSVDRAALAQILARAKALQPNQAVCGACGGARDKPRMQTDDAYSQFPCQDPFHRGESEHDG